MRSASLCAGILGSFAAVAALAVAEVKVVGSTVSAGDRFGWAAALDGDSAVVGAPGAPAEPGAAFVFRRNETSWGEVAVLGPGIASDAFGNAVAIAGDFAVVGAPGNDQNGTDTGLAYVFRRDQGGPNAWGVVTTLAADLPNNQDFFGAAVGISGETAIVGAYGRQAAYVYDRNAGGVDQWGLVAVLTASDTASGDRFGHSVALSGDTAVVSAVFDDDDGGESGSAYVFSRNQGGPDLWGQVTKLTASNAAAQDFFGRSVAIADDVIVVGADGHDQTPLDSRGAAYLFARDAGGPGAWGEVVQLGAGVTSGAFYGYSVSVQGTTAVVGAYQDEATRPDQGLAFVYSRNAGGPDAWWQVAVVAASDAANSDYFGYAVAVSGDTALAGAYQDDDAGPGSGSAYLYEALPVGHVFGDGFESGNTDAWTSSVP